MILLLFSFYTCGENSLTLEEQRKFELAIYNNDENYINYILSKTIDLNNEKKYIHLPLVVAVSVNNLKMIKQFIEYGANINQIDYIGCTCLVYANSLEVARFLIDNGAEIDYVNIFQSTPLDYFIRQNHDITKLLIEHGADINKINKRGHTPIFETVLEDDYEAFKLLVDNKADLSIVDNYGMNLLNLFAFKSCDIRIAQVLLDNGVSIFNKAGANNNCLIIASFGARKNISDKIKFVKYFISKGIDINMQNNVGDTALHAAVVRNQYEISKFLLESGADKNITNNESKTPLQIAETQNYESLIELLSH